MIVKPFQGLRPRPDLAAKIPSYPYDVVDAEEARALTRDDPYSFLHVVRPEVDLQPDVDPHDDRVYAKGRENFLGMLERGWLVRDARPAYYVYRLEMDGRAQTGIVGAAAVSDYLEGRIKRHEQTRPEKVQDRVRLADAISAHPGPVFLANRPDTRLAALVGDAADRRPEVRFTAPDGIAHALWVVSASNECQAIGEAFRQIDATYVADGHHRAEAAAQVSLLRADGPSGHFMAAHFPAEELRILDYNRVVRDLCGLEPRAFLDRVQQAGFDVSAGYRERRPHQRGSFGMYLAGAWYLLTARTEIARGADKLARLDVSVLGERLLGPILGVGDPRTDARIDFVGGIRGMDELERRVDSGTAAVAFALFPTSLEDVMQVADSGGVMPPKSTWFEPKLRSGMVVQPLG